MRIGKFELRKPTIREVMEFATEHRVRIHGAGCVLIAAALISITNLTTVEELNNKLLDTGYKFRFWWDVNLRGTNPPADLVIVGVDDSSLNLQEQIGEADLVSSEPLRLMAGRGVSWPWNRKVFAALTERLMEAGAKMVVFDIVFKASLPDGDIEFGETLDKYHDKVVIASLFYKEIDEQGRRSVTFFSPTEDLLPLEDDAFLNLVAFANVDPNLQDGKLRRVKFKTSLRAEQFPEEDFEAEADTWSLPALAAKKLGYDIDRVQAGKGRLIDYLGPPKWVPTYPIEYVFLPDRWENQFGRGAYFKDKVVFVGALSEVGFKDIFPTPLERMPGVEIHANTLASIAQDSFIADLPKSGVYVISILLSGLSLAAILGLKRTLLKQVIIFGAAIVFLVVCQVAFQGFGVAVPMVIPLSCLIVTGAYSTVFDFVLEQYERTRMRGLLSRYVSKNVADVLVNDRAAVDRVMLGERRDVTILFSDIRSFTSWSERVPPQVMVAQLNEYFDKMVGSVSANDGNLHQYVGDAIMAVWGSTPHDRGIQDDARRAVKSALEMRAYLEDLNRYWAGQEDRDTQAMGIGLNHGVAVVGNVGHVDRMEFAVLGDTTNTAARIETATKQFQQDIMVGETVYELTKDHFVYRFIGRLIFKGKSVATSVYGPLSDLETPPPPWLEIYHAGTDAYLNREFEAAIGHFRDAAAAIGKDDFLCQAYIKECEHLKVEPPPEDWGGDWRLTEK